MRHTRKKIYIGGILTITAVLAVLTVFFGQNVTNQKQETRTQATVSDREARVSLFPKDQKVTIGDIVSIAPKIVINAQRKVSSILLVMKFDKEHLELGDIDMSKKSDGMEILKVTVREKANTEGSFKILYGAQSQENAPQGVVNLSLLPFAAKKEGSSSISLSKEEVQIIYMDGVNAEISIENNANIEVVFPPTLTPSPSITPAQDSRLPERSSLSTTPAREFTKPSDFPNTSPTGTMHPTVSEE